MTKHWKAITGFPGYEVSDCGDIRTFLGVASRGKRKYVSVPRLMRTYPDDNNYLSLKLRDAQQKARMVRVHRVVSTAFLGPKPRGMQIRHLDGDRHNNTVTNLSYGTPKENGEDKVRHGRSIRGENHPSA